jgi:flagellar motor switch protein FliG
MGRPDSHATTLRRLITTLPRVVVQNRLMATGDRDVALALLYFTPDERRPILDAVSARKRQRIEEEILLQERLRISRKHYEMAASRLILALQQNSTQQSSRSYLRPLTRRPSE